MFFTASNCWLKYFSGAINISLLGSVSALWIPFKGGTERERRLSGMVDGWGAWPCSSNSYVVTVDTTYSTKPYTALFIFIMAINKRRANTLTAHLHTSCSTRYEEWIQCLSFYTSSGVINIARRYAAVQKPTSSYIYSSGRLNINYTRSRCCSRPSLVEDAHPTCDRSSVLTARRKNCPSVVRE